MAQTAKIFFTGRSQAVLLPREFRFEESEVYIRRDEITGDVILSRRPDSWAGLFELDALGETPADFLDERDRNQGRHKPDPFENDPA